MTVLPQAVLALSRRLLFSNNFAVANFILSSGMQHSVQMVKKKFVQKLHISCITSVGADAHSSGILMIAPVLKEQRMPRDHAAQDHECMEEIHIDLMMSHIILDSLQALPGLVLLGKKAKKRTVARPGGESGKKMWWEPWAPGNQTWALWREARTAEDVASCSRVMSSHLQPNMMCAGFQICFS